MAEFVDSMHLSQGKDMWKALVKTVINISVPQNAGEYLDQLRNR